MNPLDLLIPIKVTFYNPENTKRKVAIARITNQRQTSSTTLLGISAIGFAIPVFARMLASKKASERPTHYFPK